VREVQPVAEGLRQLDRSAVARTVEWRQHFRLQGLQRLHGAPDPIYRGAHQVETAYYGVKPRCPGP
jgi:hypothetical protein